MVKSNQIIYNTIGGFVTLFFQWLIIMIIPKMTDYSDAGIFAVAVSICSILNFVATFYLNQYQISDQYREYNEKEYFACRLFTIAISFAICIFVIPIFNYSLEQSLTIIAYMLYRNFIHLAYLHMATLQINNHLDYAGKCMIVEGVVSFLSFVIAFYITGNIVISTFTMAVFGGGIFLLLIMIGYNKLIGRPYPMGIIEFKKIIPMLEIGTPLLLAMLAPAFINALPKIIMQIFWSDELVGIFSTLTAPIVIIPTLITGVFTPFIVYFSNLTKDNRMDEIKKSFYKLTFVVIIFGILALLVSLLLADFFFSTLYGPELSQYVYLFHILIVGTTFYSIGMCGITVLITKKQGKEAAIASIISIIISIVLFITMVPEGGIDGAIYGLVYSYLFFFALMSAFVLFKPIAQQKTN